MRNSSRIVGVLRNASCWKLGIPEDRRGATIVMIATCIVLLMAMLAFTVDIPYMQLIRTELRIATDAAAKAGAEALKRTQKADQAIDAAIDVAAMNTVGGQKLILNKNDVVLGRITRQPNGSCSFSAGAQPFNSVRVSSHLDDKSQNGPVKLLFGSLVGVKTFQPVQNATAGQTISEICLVLDRSHSMTWDLSGTAWKYPAGITNGYNLPPSKAGSRWAALCSSVQTFTSILCQQKNPPRVGVITWGSDMATTPPFPAVSIESKLSNASGNIATPLLNRLNNVMWGATNMSAGIDAGVAMLTDPSANPLADKVMILMTDGQWNNGRDPILAAQDADAKNVRIHTICLLAGASEQVCQQIAQITGGTYTFVGDAAELKAAFVKLANQMSLVLVE